MHQNSSRLAMRATLGLFALLAPALYGQTSLAPSARAAAYSSRPMRTGARRSRARSSIPRRTSGTTRSAFNQGISQARLDSEFGNATRNNPKLRSPWNFNENVALGRTFRFRERSGFQVRGGAFNLLNRVRWGGATSGVTSPTFGRVTTQANTARRMQIGLKLTF